MDKIKEIIEKKNQIFKLKFEEQSHKYFIEENFELISVTTKISKYFPFDKQKVSREVAQRQWTSEDEVLEEWEILKNNGSYIHTLADKYCSNQKLEQREDELITNVKQFFKDNPNLKIVASEIRVFSKKYKVAGTIDLIVKDKDKYYILDWKTSRKEISKNEIYQMAKHPFNTLANNKFNIYSLQLSCYQLILKEEYNIDIYDNIIVHLRYNQTYSKIEPMNLLYEAKELLNN